MHCLARISTSSSIINTNLTDFGLVSLVCIHVFIYTCNFFRILYLHRSRGASCLKKRTNSLSDESSVILSLDPYFLKFYYNFKVKAKNFLLETFPFDKYKRYIILDGDSFGDEIVWW